MTSLFSWKQILHCESLKLSISISKVHIFLVSDMLLTSLILKKILGSEGHITPISGTNPAFRKAYEMIQFTPSFPKLNSLGSSPVSFPLKVTQTSSTFVACKLVIVAVSPWFELIPGHI
jgi:hypothetical protein